MSEDPNKQTKSKKSGKTSSSDSIIGGWIIISSLCIVAFFLDVPIGIIIVAIIGYAISAS